MTAQFWVGKTIVEINPEFTKLSFTEFHPTSHHCPRGYFLCPLDSAFAHSYNPGQNLLRQIAKMPIFSCHAGKNWNLRQMNVRFPPFPYLKLFKIAWQLYTLVFGPRQLWIGGGEGVYFLCLEETGVGRKSSKIGGIVSTVLSGVVAIYF